MGSNKNLTDILEKFNVSLKESEKRSSLTDKLRHHAETIRKVQGIASNAILMQGNTALFLQFLADSQQTPIQYQDMICTNLGIQHDVLLRFEAGRCSVTSALFPSPFFVTEILPKEKTDYCMVTILNFFNMIKVIKVFDGARVIIENKK